MSKLSHLPSPVAHDAPHPSRPKRGGACPRGGGLFAPVRADGVGVVEPGRKSDREIVRMLRRILEDPRLPPCLQLQEVANVLETEESTYTILKRLGNASAPAAAVETGMPAGVGVGKQATVVQGHAEKKQCPNGTRGRKTREREEEKVRFPTNKRAKKAS